MTWPDSRWAGAEVLVLHSLRCVGHASVSRVAAATGLPESVVESELIDLGAGGHVAHTPGEFGGWGLTTTGRALDAERITDELESAGARTAVTEAYHRFLALNPELLDLCAAWQMRSTQGVLTANDHADPGYDARVLEQLSDLDDRAQVVCAQLSAAVVRFGRYGLRLADALVRARSGALEYVATSTSSYHTVWFQLHEDLLATLGIPRF